ncbi:hypothetical protein niasHS_012025 [Heterodera schachtii]|uniref:Uncharacterized protein n=1 Tax=Heterodera schachtii TaxID=97005 RepID=A0ABD2IDN7_HETSC
MDWKPTECSLCDDFLKCMRPRGYEKPIICLHPDIENLTDYLRKAPTTAADPPSPQLPATTTNALATPETPSLICPSTTLLSILLWFCTAMIFVLFVAQLVFYFFQARRAIAQHKFRKRLKRGQQLRMQTVRRHQQPQQVPPPLVVPPMRSGTNTADDNISEKTLRADQPIYDVPFTPEEEDDSF